MVDSNTPLDAIRSEIEELRDQFVLVLKAYQLR